LVYIGKDETNIPLTDGKKTLNMAKRSIQTAQTAVTDPDQVFELAAEVFRVMSAPMRLKIISCLCDGEKNVSYLLSKIDTTQPNMSQHLTTLYQAGVLGKRRDGVQIYYRIIDERISLMCRTVCTQIATEGVHPAE
jgi:ArsR family transcriptional regulator